MPKLKDLSGIRFEKLTVECLSDDRYDAPCGNSYVLWRCKCDCGNTTLVTTSDLRSKHTKSCGCSKSEFISTKKTKHGQSSIKNKTIEYVAWNSMMQRCNNKNNISYVDYGGRGISVCKEWSGKDGFINFVNDLGKRPGKDYSLDRIDANKDYCAENCRWLSAKKQAQNRRSSRSFVVNGKTYNLMDYCKENNIHYGTVLYRINKLNKTIEEAASKPISEFVEKVQDFKSKFFSNFIGQSKRRGFVRTNDDLTAEDAWDIFASQNFKCKFFSMCGNSKDNGSQMTLDHITPKSKNGFHTASNVQWLCKSCNCSKINNDEPNPVEKRNRNNGPKPR